MCGHLLNHLNRLACAVLLGTLICGCRPQSAPETTQQGPQQSNGEAQAGRETSAATSEPVSQQTTDTAPSTNARVVEITHSDAPGLIIQEGVAVVAPFQVLEEDRSIKIVGAQGNVVVLKMFYNSWDRHRTDRLPKLPEYITADLSWGEIRRKSDPLFIGGYCNELKGYIALNFDQKEAKQEFTRQVRRWPFVVSATWETNKWGDKPFLRVVSRGGDTYDLFTNWGDPEKLKDLIGNFLHPEVWGFPDIPKIRDSIAGRGEEVEERIRKRKEGTFRWLRKCVQEGGVYVRFSKAGHVNMFWARGQMPGQSQGKTAKDYAEVGRILKGADDHVTKANRIYDYCGVGLVGSARGVGELNAIKMLIEEFNQTLRVAAWFEDRERDFAEEERARKALEAKRRSDNAGQKIRVKPQKVVKDNAYREALWRSLPAPKTDLPPAPEALRQDEAGVLRQQIRDDITAKAGVKSIARLKAEPGTPAKYHTCSQQYRAISAKNKTQRRKLYYLVGQHLHLARILLSEEREELGHAL